ncbi:MAG TPA: tRNA-(ms[2]io[6]A)-hydroxylase [Porticoccaceae bacterium]|nr:tRNA-(ms[2]io[6]A)-hydroxylase [Porticoccaceae bacterium]
MRFEQFSRVLACPTPETWVQAALRHQDLLLIDHANCEKKAASTALNLLFRYAEHHELLQKVSRLAREELRHFEQVTELMQRRGIEYRHLPAAEYAGELRKLVRSSEPHRLVDTLIASAIIEARSCERFACLAPHLDDELGGFYISLLKSEARHYRDYIAQAGCVASEEEINDRIEVFSARERELIETPCVEFRFHSGPLYDTSAEIDEV